MAVRGAGDGRSGFRLSVVLAAGGFVLAGASRRDGADTLGAAGVGALRLVRTGVRMLMRDVEELVMAPMDGGSWWICKSARG